MSISRRRAGAAIFVGSGLIAAVASVAVAATIPRAFDARGGDSGVSEPLTLAPDVGSTSATEPALPRNPLWAIPLKSLRATLERPLFSPSRRPPMRPVASGQFGPAKLAAPLTSAQPPLDLLGVVTGSGDGYAVFLSTATHDIVRLRTGEGHDGWILQSVKGRQVILENNDRAVVVALPQPSADKNDKK